jgi:hypothetical protein
VLIKNYLIIIILLLIFSPAFSGCWGHGSVCTTDCYQGVTPVNIYTTSAPGLCHLNTVEYTTSMYYTFASQSRCGLNQGHLGYCIYGITPTTVYSPTGASTPCGSCAGTLNCGFCHHGIGTSDECDVVSVCYEKWVWEWRNLVYFKYYDDCLPNPSSASCASLTSPTDCTINSCDSCHWDFKNKLTLSSGFTAFASTPLCTYYSTLCPLPYKRSLDGTNNCRIPACYNEANCVNGFGPGFICSEPGKWNASCEINSSFPFGSTVYKTINGEKYEFSTRLDFLRTPWLDVYTSQNELLYYGLNNKEQFNLGNLSYVSYYELPIEKGIGTYAFSLYGSELINRLTYNIFPVCGNGICETCESEDNCLHYPPESCYSCSADCPSTSYSDLSTYNKNGKVLQPLSFEDVLTEPDNACKVRTMDPNSICNPLCVAHAFIDNLGCIFNRYANALAESDFNSSISIKQTNISFNSETYEVYISLDNMSFYGANNSLCSSSCECVPGSSCTGVTGDKHCCPLNYEWKYVDEANEFCDNGVMKPKYKEDFLNYDIWGKIKSTLKISMVQGGLSSTGGINANDYICLTSSNTVYAGNKSSCYAGYDPYCVYGNPNTQFSVIKPNGEGQCREKNYVTPEVVPQLRCTIHTHAWAYATCEQPRDGWWGCVGDEFGSVPYNRIYCVTDNAYECASYFSIRSLNNDVILRSITYEDFCKTPELVCGGNKYMKNDGALGGMLNFVNCPQDGYGHYDGSDFDELFSSEWYDYDSLNIPIGYYCSLFGNDYDIIFGVDSGNLYDKGATTAGTYSFNVNKYSPLTAEEGSWIEFGTHSAVVDLGSWGFKIGNTQYIKSTHLPMINRDENEKLYHLLWNYESCKKVFKDEIDFTCATATTKDPTFVQSSLTKNLMTQDLAVDSYPAFHFLGQYEYPVRSSTSKFIVSRDFCEQFWEKYSMPFYPLNYTARTYSSGLTVNGTTIEADDINTYIAYSCIYWNEDVLNKYYDESVSANSIAAGMLVIPPFFQWGIQTRKQYGASDGPVINTYKPLNIDYWPNTGHCQANSLVKTGEKCRSDYPKKLPFAYNVDNDYNEYLSGAAHVLDRYPDWPMWKTCDCTYNEATGSYPNGCI